MKAICSACGAKAKSKRTTYHFKEIGLPKVYLMGVEIIHCDQCGNEDPIIPRMNDLMRALVLAVVHKPCRLCGEELRFLRKHIGLTGEMLSGYLHVDKTTLSKWENNEDKIGEQSDRLIRLVTLSLGEGPQEKLKEIVKCFPQIKTEARPAIIQMDAKTFSYQYA